MGIFVSPLFKGLLKHFCSNAVAFEGIYVDNYVICNYMMYIQHNRSYSKKADGMDIATIAVAISYNHNDEHLLITSVMHIT